MTDQTSTAAGDATAPGSHDEPAPAHEQIDATEVDTPEVDATEVDEPETGGPDTDDEEAAATGSSARRGRGASASRLEEEGDVAADYLEELLDIVDLDGDIDIDVENGRASLSIVADPVSTRSLRRLVGPEGAVLEALQELTRLAVQARTGERSRLMLDIAGFRAARRTDLEALAARAVAECARTGEPVRLDPMTPFERKVVHDAIASAGLVSESEGEEPLRRVVVKPAASS